MFMSVANAAYSAFLKVPVCEQCVMRNDPVRFQIRFSGSDFLGFRFDGATDHRKIKCTQLETHIGICLFLRYLLKALFLFEWIGFQTLAMQELGERATVLNYAPELVPAVCE